MLAMMLVLLGVPDSLDTVRRNVVAARTTSTSRFAMMNAMWESVRRSSGPDDRIASNPLAMADMTLWPVNISWSLLSGRRSCYAGRELALAFAAVPNARRIEIDETFQRVFAGDPAPGDLARLVQRDGCSVFILTVEDPAWDHDPFAASPLFRPVEGLPNRWRIYKRA
jgi:hypothetical protein